MVKPYKTSGYKIDITGKRFGRITVLSFSRKTEKRQSMWLCLCDCGEKKEISGNRLRSGKTQSCGCYRTEKQASRSKTHGLSYTDEYRIYKGILNRCYNRNVNAYPHYGGKGIQVCDRWRYGDGEKSGVECFYDDMGKRPSKKHSIERDRIGGDYSPDNCRWATAKEQANNTSRNRYINVCGETMSVSDACDYFGKDYFLVLRRIQGGWDPEAAMLAPKGMKEIEFLRGLSSWDSYCEMFYVSPQRREIPGLKEIDAKADAARPIGYSGWNMGPYKEQ
jgi:hypothetical protein